MHQPDYKDYYSKYNHMILKSCKFQVKRLHLVDALSRANPQDKMELKGLDFTIHELTPCMTPIQVSII